MKKNKNVAIFVGIILVISVITGFIYGLNKNVDTSEFVSSINGHSNLFFNHTISIIIIFFSTLALVNFISGALIFSIEGLSTGFLLGVLFKNYKLNGFFFGIISTIINRLLFIIILIYLFIISINYINKVIKNILGLKNDYIRSLIKPLLMRFSLILVISLINDTLIYFLGNIILKNFVNML